MTIDASTWAAGHGWSCCGNRKRTRGHLNLEHRKPPVALAFAPDGQTLAVAAGSLILLWDVASGEKQATLRGHASEVTALSWTPDGRTLISGGKDRTVRSWDVRSGRERAVYQWPIGKVFAVAVCLMA